MTTDIVMSIIDRKEANRIADIAEKNNGQWFAEHYGVLWPMKYSSFVIAALVRAKIREYRNGWKCSMSRMKEIITVDYIREMFELNGFSKALWLGDATTEILINTYLLAFLHDGKHVDYDEDTGTEESGGYTLISGDRCKFHSNYKGWKLYRAWDVSEDHGKMRYFAVKDEEIREARNLSGIKAEC